MLSLLAAALAYEADSLTHRDQPLPDVTAILDQRVQDVILEAIDWTNERTRCEADPQRTHELLARAIHVRNSSNEMVGDRGGLRAFGFDRYSAWIEKGGAPRRDFGERNDIFGSTTAAESPLLKWAGVCSTVRVNDVLLGTDKLDHFFEEGFNAWRKSEEGVDFDAAVDWMTRTENTRYGLKTSETFSWGDLKADWDGMHFYDGLLELDGVARIAEDGCLVETNPFSWADWLTWEYDEVLNPPIYTPSAQRGVDRHLALNQQAYCAEYANWGGDDYQAHLEQVLQSSPDYASAEAPLRYDPYELDALCQSAPAPLLTMDRPRKRRLTDEP